MIEQSAIGLNSRSEANPYNEDGFLPLITAPIYSTVDESNYQVFLDNKIQVCLPRNNKFRKRAIGCFEALSLSEFESYYCNSIITIHELHRVCIDTAAGHLKKLHEAIRKAKEIHGDNLIIMAGNVASVEAFVALAQTGVDYIRVGIGGGDGCNTTPNVGVGQENLEELIKECYRLREVEKNGIEYLKQQNLFQKVDQKASQSLANVKIVADGISSYIKLCQEKYGFNDNGYAAINKLLFSGADLVMVGKLFAQCTISAGEKSFKTKDGDFRTDIEYGTLSRKEAVELYFKRNELYVKYAGMSTHTEQKKYKNPVINSGGVAIMDLKTGDIEILKEPDTPVYLNLKPSEGSVKWIPVRFLLKEWLEGNDNQDEYPYLMGWINSIKSAMSYTGLKTLKDINNKK